LFIFRCQLGQFFWKFKYILPVDMSQTASLTTKRRSSDRDENNVKISRQQSPPKTTNSLRAEIETFLKENLEKMINQNLSNLLPTFLENIKQSIEKIVHDKMDELQRSNNAPPPPPAVAPIIINDQRNEWTTITNKAVENAKKQLSPILDKRIRRYYQHIRHTNLANLFTTNLQLQDPKLPRKFAEKIGRFDQSQIIEKKRKMTVANVENEIEILNIYAESDEDKLTGLDKEAEGIIKKLSPEDAVFTKDWYETKICANEAKSKKIWENKMKFLTSERYLIPLSQLVYNNYDNNVSHDKIKDNNHSNYNSKPKFNHFSNQNYKINNEQKHFNAVTNPCYTDNTSRNFSAYNNNFNQNNTLQSSFRRTDQNFWERNQYNN